MKVKEIAEALNLQVLAGKEYLGENITGGYAADLLSCVMAGAKSGDIWITLQTHANIVAVAALLGIPAIIVTEGAPVPPETLTKAEQQEVVVLSSSQPTFETIAQLIKLGL
ncbi:MAG: hypothetical protein JW981_02790, partial [Anaerolineae bacterium]|nr:hypothetical protein [Anaerolineae bacterium]